MKVGEHELEFNPELHQYVVDGKIIPSVTQVLAEAKFGHKYDGINEDVLENARCRGSELHNAVDNYEKSGLERDDLIEFRDYKFLKRLFGFKVLQTEMPVVIDIDGFMMAGTFDQLEQANSLFGLADIKRTSVLDKEYVSYQLNLYRIGYEQCYPDKKIDFLKAIHLRDGVRRYVDIPINEEVTKQLVRDYMRRIENA